VPIYDYICRDCGQRTEVIHGIDAPGPKFCPACGAEGTLRKAFVAPTVHYRGSGWAKKDRSTASRARARSDGDGAATDGTDRSSKAAEGSGPAGDAAGSDAKSGSAGSDAKPGSAGSDSGSTSGGSDAGASKAARTSPSSKDD